MKKLVLPSEVEGRLEAPPSKSQTIRALAAGLMAEGESRLINPSFCDDSLACLHLIQRLGAEVEAVNDGLYQSFKVKGGFPEKNPLPPRETTLSCGESALTMRLFAAIVSLQPNPVRLRAKGTLTRRPMDMVEEPLRRFNVICQSQAGFPPLQIKGPMGPGLVSLDASRSSQFLTGLLMALPRLADDSEVLALNLRSKPYVELTIDLIQKFGIKIKAFAAAENYWFLIPGGQSYRPAQIKVEGDWSGASFFIVAGALAGRVELLGLHPDSKQADRMVLEALKAAGGKFSWEGDRQDARLVVERVALHGFEMDASDCPDLFPPLCVLAAGAKGRSKISGAQRLGLKESDRAASLVAELSRVGAKITREGDSIIVEGGNLIGGVVDSRADHRIAMAGAIAGLISREGIVVRGCEAVRKSFPDFFEKLKTCRGEVR
ncbi:MAG: 3-phosphoshikimate 1-carboxyvinyltransferase [Candidatus Aminicenantales bacterium]